MKRMAVVLTVMMGCLLLTTIALADDVDDIKAATMKHFTAFNAGDAAAHVRHHLAENTGFPPEGGLLEESASIEAQRKDLQALFDAGMKPNLELQLLKVKVYGDTAVVTSYVVGTMTSPEGKTEQIKARRTAVLIKQDGEWKEAHNHTSPLTTPLEE